LYCDRKIYHFVTSMTYCLNPHCQQPENPPNTKFCLSCGSALLLKERYRAIKLIGAGGFGRTFLGVDEDRLKTPCAIKQFFPQTQNSAALTKATELFNREAVQLLKLGEHPQIPGLYGYFEQDKRLYLVQEFIDGANLLQELQQQGAFSEAKIWQLLRELLPVLQFIHENGVIHRDIKPENILRRWRRQVGSQTQPTAGAPESPATLVLVDFGVAKQGTQSELATSGTITGTQGYAPLEQIWRGQAFPASDLYSLGVTCIHLLTQVPPDRLFDSNAGQWIWRQVLAKKGGSVSDELGEILDKMLVEAVKDRYQSASDVLQSVNRQSGQGVTQVSWPVHNLPGTHTTAPPTAPPTAPTNTSIQQRPAQPPDEISTLLEKVKTELSEAQPKSPKPPASVKTPAAGAESSNPPSKSQAFDPIQADLEALKAEFGEKS
jgi:serine/threonine protein kinase